MLVRTITGLAGVVAVLLLGSLVTAHAQQAGRSPRIGVLTHGDPSTSAPAVEALRRGLRELGYVEGQTITLEVRWDEGKPERFVELAADLVRLKVDVIVAGTSAAIPAAKQATTTIPVVMTTAINPVENGWIASLARPGGNITGLTIIATGLSGKRMQLLKEAVPSASHVAVLWHPGYGPAANLLKETEVAARALGIRTRALEIVGPDEFESAFRKAAEGQARAVITIQGPFFWTHRARIAELGLKHRMPTLSAEMGFAQAGGLMHHGPDPFANFHHAATYVDKILKGFKPADLPVQQPIKFELAINLKTAKALGVTIPSSLLLQADRVIE